jgi:TrmH family RNA methyltransferase
MNISDEIGVGFRQLETTAALAKIKRLQSDRHYRDKNGLFFAEGIRNFVQAVDQNFSIDALIYSERLLISPIARKQVRRLKREGVAFARVSPEQFRAISQTERASGVAAIFRQQIVRLDEIEPSSQICWIALNTVRSPGNLGSLMRTSAAVGAGGFILVGDSIDPFDPNVVRATMGAIFKQKFARANMEQFRDWVTSHNLQVVGASPDGTVDYDQIRYTPPTVLILGNERSGLTQNQKLICQQLVRIPMREGMDSLNVAVAGSLLLYQLFRSADREGCGSR